MTAYELRFSDWSSDGCSADRAEFNYFRFPRGIFHDALALRQYGRHQRIFGRADGNDRKSDRAAGKAALGRACLHIARRNLDFRAKGFQRFQVQVNGTVPNRAATRQRYRRRSEEHTSELQSLMRISYAVFCLKKKHKNIMKS